MSKIHKGGCMCGAVQYEVRGSFGPIVYCHCSVCRKAQGTAFGTNAPIQENDFALLRGAEALKGYESSPGKQRVFCSHCGSPIYSRNQALPGVLRLRVGTLDTPLDVRPVAHIYATSKANWFEILDGLPQYEALPPPATKQV